MTFLSQFKIVKYSNLEKYNLKSFYTNDHLWKQDQNIFNSDNTFKEINHISGFMVFLNLSRTLNNSYLTTNVFVIIKRK